MNTNVNVNEIPKLNRVIRLDSIPLDQTYFTEEGYLRDRPILTRVGIFEYTNSDGSIRRELRLPEDVFDPASLSSYKGKPVVISHDAGLINKENVGEESIGTVLSEGFRDGDNVRAEIVIHDTDAMKQSKMKELSLGYSLDLEETPGKWNGQRYDAIQRNIRINHLALVREARAGERARLNIDGRDRNKKQGGKIMKKVSHRTARVDGILSAEELEKAIAEYKAKYGAQNAEAEKTDAEETEEVVAPVAAPAEKKAKPAPKVEVEVEDADDPEAEQMTVEEQVEEIKDEHKDEDNPDMQKLFDIIDSLLAEREFKKGKTESADAEEEVQEPAKEEVTAEEEIVTDADDTEESEDVEFVGEEEELDGEDEEEEEVDMTELDIPDQEDGDDDIIPYQEAEDCGRNCDDMDDPIPDFKPSNLKPGEVMNADSVDKIVRARIDVGMMGKALNMDGLERMNIMAARKAVIRAVRPGMRLDGKSAAFINAAYAMACEEVRTCRRKDTKYQKRQMFNGTKRKMAHADSSDKARDRMIRKQLNRK